MPIDPALARLTQMRHIVVVMMANRSFDQMLGYLKRDGLPEVNGLRGDEVNLDADGKAAHAFDWRAGETVFDPPEDHAGKVLDPCHSAQCVQEQLADDNDGFVRNFIATRKDPNGNPVSLTPQYRRLPMGYFAKPHLPVYDFLARNFCVCDAWHSSVPGDTWPNRLFALAGRESDKALPVPFKLLLALFRNHLRVLSEAPIYKVEAFTRQLQNHQWRWYSHDPATLRAADARYRRFGDLDRANFAFFDRQKVSLLTQLLEDPIVSPDSFLDDCASERLRDVSWIDPELRSVSTSAGARSLLKLGIAVRKSTKGGDEDTPTADFFDVTVWGAEAENCAKYLRKGRLAAVSGRLEPTAWEAADGSKRRGMEIIATGIEFLDRPPREAASTQQQPQEVPAAA